MEAATPLRQPSVRTLGERVVVDGLALTDPCLLRLVREREEAGGDPVRLVEDATEIGARVLDREQTTANADFVRAEFEKTSREVESAFAERAREASQVLERQLDEVFGPESGHLARALDRHFSDGSSDAVHNRVREVVRETMGRAREELIQQFSSADGRNPLADFKSASIGAIRQMGDRQDTHLRGLLEKMGALERELQGLRDERDKQLELAGERERGTAKGRTYEESVAEALDAIALAQGDDCDAVGDVRGATGKVGDVVVAIDGCHGPARGRIVFEAKDSKLSKPEALRQLERAREERDAAYAVLVVPSEEELPARTRPLREVNGDKLFVVYDPEEGSRLALEVAYTLARARVIATRGGEDGIDARGGLGDCRARPGRDGGGAGDKAAAHRRHHRDRQGQGAARRDGRQRAPPPGGDRPGRGRRRFRRLNPLDAGNLRRVPGESPIRRRVVVHGRVQGVFFRDSTRAEAESAGVAGWVTNRSDGAVEAVFEGAPDSVKALVHFCRSGPSSADVDDVEVGEEPPEGLSGFEVR